MAGENTRAPQTSATVEDTSEADRVPCRLCGAPADFWTRKRLLNRQISYYLCSGCGSLETETPYWLDEAYDVSGIGDDLGAGQRTIDLVLKTSALLDRINLPQGAQCIDFGGGIGLFTRLMRDRGFNFFSSDRYATPFFSDRYSVASLAGESPAVVTAFEVFEHFPDPAQDLQILFETRPALVIATTELFTGQDEDWPYFAEGTGQHVFFYSPRAINGIAKRFGYSVALVDGLIVFVSANAVAHLGMTAANVLAILKPLARNNMLMRHGLALFAKHQREPYKYIMREVEAAQRLERES